MFRPYGKKFTPVPGGGVAVNLLAASEARTGILFMGSAGAPFYSPSPLPAAVNTNWLMNTGVRAVHLTERNAGDIVKLGWNVVAGGLFTTMTIEQFRDADMPAYPVRRSQVRQLVFGAAGTLQVENSGTRIGLIFFPTNQTLNIGTADQNVVAGNFYQISTSGTPVPLLEEEVGSVVKEAWKVFAPAACTVMVLEVFPPPGVDGAGL